MLKKIFLAVLTTALLLLSLASCGNYDSFDTVYTYNRAIITLPDGSTMKIDVESWSDYESEQLQIEAKDGTVYLVNSVNCILIRDPDYKDK